MKLRDLASWSPTHWILTALAVVCAIAAFFGVISGLGFRWDPFDLVEKRADRAEARLQTTRSDRDARTAEVVGARATTRLVERAAADRAAATDIVNRYAREVEAQTHDPEASATAVPDDGSDLRDVIGELCDLRPTVCAGHDRPAPPRDAGDGPRSVPDPGSSR